MGRAAQTDPVIDAVLEPGDALYLPRGWLHAATAQGQVSIHLTLGIHNWTRYGVAEQLAQAALAQLQDDPQMRASLPLGESHPSPEVLEAIRQAMVSALTAADPGPSIDRVSRSQARPAPLGPLAQHAAMRDLDDASPLTLRAGLDATLEGNRLRTRIGWFDFSDAELPVVRTLLDGDPASVADIGRPLAERLLAAGALVPALG